MTFHYQDALAKGEVHAVKKDSRMSDELQEDEDEEKFLDNIGKVVYSEQVEQILAEQSLLLMEYADKIGYIVAQGQKR
ncbi:hypothetical protein MUB24_04560 [Lederbergia sp. NSJ-179]|uniref:hypothetical protein n=1 Tax=Lederbergia sp. NSJ-179 TaxID=2931402 RepID=UPI001FD3E5BB|nr:hypothetical protein [Lederbergia sp. NSJ-179]MCJ7840195.1 hypothetical protein [Lederbergia sp. NSJ-179]